jgi:hypothetical protein
MHDFSIDLSSLHSHRPFFPLWNASQMPFALPSGQFVRLCLRPPRPGQLYRKWIRKHPLQLPNDTIKYRLIYVSFLRSERISAKCSYIFCQMLWITRIWKNPAIWSFHQATMLNLTKYRMIKSQVAMKKYMSYKCSYARDFVPILVNF